MKRTFSAGKYEVMRLIDAGNGPQVWYLLNFALWWKEYIK